MNKGSISNAEAYKPQAQKVSVRSSSTVQFHLVDKPFRGSIFPDDNLLVFVLRGSFGIRHGSLEYGLEKNQMAFLRKERLVELFTKGNLPEELNRCEYLLISLKPDLVKEFMRLADLKLTSQEESRTVKTSPISGRLHECVNLIKSIVIGTERVGENLIKIKLLELLFYIAESEQGILHQVLDLREQFRTNITGIVEENIMNSLSLNQLADLSGRSLSSFRRDFLAIYNMSPSRWIRQKRLEKARELLRCTTMTITDICYTLGFENIAHFSRLFKAHFQHSPSAYRLNAALNVLSRRES